MAGPSREGEVLDGKFRIARKLGEGGMGAVYAGEHIRLKKTVAIKMLHAGANTHAEMADRFEREAQAASQIGSDHIVEVFDIGITPSGDRFMVMEYLEGEPLRTRLKRVKRMREVEIAAIAVQILEGLRAAHAAGIIHRDLKPDNIFICREKGGRRDFVKVLDFGISKFLQAGEEGSVTKTGTIMGSPNYMSPEHVQASHEVDARSDLYSVGVMLFEAVTAKLPRKAATFAEILFKVVYEPVPDPRSVASDVEAEFAQIVMTACAHDKAHRYQSAEQFKGALEAYLRTHAQAWQSADLDVGSGPTDEILDRTIALAAGAPRSSASNPGAISQPQLSGSQPSFGGSYPNASASHPGLAVAAGSQPGFGSGSQPSFATGSQPSFATGSQPSFGPASVGSGSQPSFASPFSVTHQPSGEAPRPRSRAGFVAAVAGAAFAGIAIAVVAAMQLGAAPAASTKPATTGATAAGASVAESDPAAPTSSLILSEPSSSAAVAAAASATPSSATTSSVKAPGDARDTPAVPKPVGKGSTGKPQGSKPGGINAGY